MDIVFIEQLSVITTIGVYDWEQTIEQKLVFDIEMAWDNRKAAKSDTEEAAATMPSSIICSTFL